MKLSIPAAALVALASVAFAATACLTTYNKPKFTQKEGAPAVEKRPEGCNVDVFEDGVPVERPHLDIGTAVLDWPMKKMQEQGPDGAINTLKAYACETGAFIIKDLRALAMGVNEGMIYEATFATLLGDDGKPINLAQPKDAAPATAEATPAAPPGAGGW